MTDFVKSIRRLFSSQKITLLQVKNLLSEKKITSEEYTYILNGKEAGD